MTAGKKWKYLAAGAAAAALVGALAVLIFGDNGKKNSETQPSETAQSADVLWQGAEYNYREHLSNFLFIGVDNWEKEQTATGQGNAGQADALYLLSWDRVLDEVTVVTIPRDTMAQIETYGPGGKSLGKTKDHISLSYAYGDGGHESCRLTKEAVSELLYGLPIEGYCSINLEGIPVFTRCLGQVTVTVPNDSLAAVDPAFQEGSQISLDEHTTEMFVRYRDTGVSQSAMDRMERQQEYIRAFGQAARARYAEDSSFVTELYEELELYMVTNMGNDKFARILESIAEGTVREGWTVPGEAVEGQSYDEYRVDDEALYQKIIETFYQEAN